MCQKAAPTWFDNFSVIVRWKQGQSLKHILNRIIYTPRGFPWVKLIRTSLTYLIIPVSQLYRPTTGRRRNMRRPEHSGPKMPKSKPWGESPNFVWQMKEGYIGISKYKIFFKSVEGNYLQFSDISWTRVPPCPSTWHKFEIRIQKWQIWDPISALLFLIRFLFSNGISIELAFIYSQIRFCSNYRP